MPAPAPRPRGRPDRPPDARATASPVTDAYRRLAGALPGMRVTETAEGEPLPRGAGWVHAARLAEGGPELDAFLAWDEAQVIRDHGRRPRPDVTATFGLHRYAWPACLLITAPWFLLRRVPRMPVEHVAHHRESGAVAVRVTAFACLPGDPAAGLPGARVVPDEEALRAEVRAAAAEHLEPVLGGFGPRTRRRGRALWGLATDEIVEGLWHVARLFGEEPGAGASWSCCCPARPGRTSARRRSATWPAPPAGRCPPATGRAAACSTRWTPRTPAPTCPRTCDAERVGKSTVAGAS